MQQIIEKVCPDIWKLRAESNIYFLDFDKKIIIDTGDRAERLLIKQFLSKVVDLKKVDFVIFTHLHYDHIGNFDIFENCMYYASKESIEDFKRMPESAVLQRDMAERFKAVNLNPLPGIFGGLRVIHTPGHTRGSVCLWYEKEKVLFSGDTLFFNRNLGRTDLPTSVPGKMQESVTKLVEFNYKILCPGHDY